MYVIEGKSGKSRVLAYKIEELIESGVGEEHIIVIDFVNISHVLPFGVDFISGVGELDAERLVRKLWMDYRRFREYKHLILSLNAKGSDLEWLSYIEGMLGLKVIVTVQNDDLPKIREYEWVRE